MVKRNNKHGYHHFDLSHGLGNYTFIFLEVRSCAGCPCGVYCQDMTHESLCEYVWYNGAKYLCLLEDIARKNVESLGYIWGSVCKKYTIIVLRHLACCVTFSIS